MAEYNFRDIEKKWQAYWDEHKVFEAANESDKPKFYALDMFPYPSGAGLHVGHPLGYIASDIVSRYKRLQGYNVLHPMGFDAFGLPAEQHAIATGQHPAITTEAAITRYKEQLRGIGFSFDWSREIQTCAPDYYKWTQWIFKELYQCWYDHTADKARHFDDLVAILDAEGNGQVKAACDDDTPTVSAAEWKAMDAPAKQQLLDKYRLTYLADAMVNWCPALGTVLANDEVKDGLSERGGHPVERKKMRQWMMRITAYAQRLLDGIDRVDMSEPLKEMQRNWIGRSVGAQFYFEVENAAKTEIHVFTTRLDTVYGVSFLALAPESELVAELTTDEQREAVEAYVETAKNRSERERQADVKTVSGAFTGSYAINPFDGAKIPVWVADYVLAGYGTGAVMAVPAHDERDFRFAKHFDLPILQVVDGADVSEEAWVTWDHPIINSDFMNGLKPKEAIQKGVEFLEEKGIGSGKINFKMRDAVFSRQRYWGEPVPVYFEGGMTHLVEDEALPLTLPEIDAYLPTETGEPPLARATDWKAPDGQPYELSTMPGWAGSSWYFFRYMDPTNDKAFVDPKVQQYWEGVDLYIGGAEHAVGHLLYSRFWTKFLYDRGHVTVDEYFKKLINQGMIQGRSNFVYRKEGTNTFVSHGLRKEHKTVAMHVDVNIVDNDVLDTEAFKAWRPDLADAEFVLEDGKYLCGAEVEKMSKSKYNVVNPDVIIEKYGADTLRLYEMFLGPLEQFKPWNTNGIDGVFKFLRKFWNLFHKGDTFGVSDAAPSAEELKVLHRTLKKTTEDIERYSFNTCVSNFMIGVNDLTSLKCNKQAVLEPLVIALAPFAPHLAEELWQLLGHEGTISDAEFPAYDEQYLVEDTFEYPISINGKMRVKLALGADMGKDDIENAVLAHEAVQKWVDGKTPKKVIVVPKRIVNIVV